MTDSVNTFAGLPQFMWENIFGLLKYLVPGVVLALFAAYYQNRRKREIKIEGKIAVKRIETYEKILSLFYQAQDLLMPTLAEEEKAKALLGYFPLMTFRFQYPKMFAGESAFDSFYKRFQELQRDCQIYLDYPVSHQMNSSLGVFTLCKYHLDAFSDTEHITDFKFSDSQAHKHIDWVYQLCGMLMFSQSTRAFVELDNVIGQQLRHFRITYRKHRLQKLWGTLRDHFLFFFDVRMAQKGFRGKLSRGVIFRSLSSDGRETVDILAGLTEIMRYVHFSDKYSPSDFFEGHRRPPQKEIELYNKAYLSQVHRS